MMEIEVSKTCRGDISFDEARYEMVLSPLSIFKVQANSWHQRLPTLSCCLSHWRNFSLFLRCSWNARHYWWHNGSKYVPNDMRNFWGSTTNSCFQVQFQKKSVLRLPDEAETCLKTVKLASARYSTRLFKVQWSKSSWTKWDPTSEPTFFDAAEYCLTFDIRVYKFTS